FRRFDYNTATMDSGSVDQFALRDLPYGNYELLTVFNRDAYGEQLISQFADGMDVVVPVTMCASVTNVSFTERDAYASVQLPPPPVDASVPGIQSMTVTSSAEVAMAGDRLQFTVKFACVPGAGQEGRTLSFNSDGSRFTIDGASLSLTDAAGNRISGYELDNDHLVVPENAGILTGSLIVTGTASGSDSAFAALLTIAGTAGNSSAPRFRTRCTIQDFKAQIPDTVRGSQGRLTGRGTAGAVLTVKAVSKTDPSRSATTDIEVGRYGYWTGDVTYPIDGVKPDTFAVTIKDSEGRLLAEGETAYEADQVLPEKIVITTYMNGAKNITTGYPGSKKDFESLNNAVLQFGPDYTHVPIEVELTFSDTDPDAYGMTDARRVHDPELKLQLPNYNDGGGLCYAFYPVDTLTYHYHNDDLGLDIPNAVYSTKWLASFPAFHFGKFAISYELFDGEGDIDLPALDDHTDFSKYVMNSLGLTSAAAQQYRSALVETGNWINGYEGGEYAHTGHYEAEVLWSDPGIQIKDLDSSVVKAGADPEMYLLKPVEDVSAEFTVDASMSWKALDSGEYEDAVAELTRKQPGYSQSYSSANSFIKYIDRSAEYSIVYNNSADPESRGTFDLKISTSYTAIIDSGVLGDGSLMDDGDFISRGYIISENVDSTVLGLTAEHAGGVVDDVLELREGASTILSKTYAKVGLNDLAAQEANIAKWSSRLSTASTVIGAATNALSFGMTVRTELTGENKAIIDLNRMAADYNRRMQDYCDKLLAKITCFDRKNHNQRISSEIANIKDGALNEIAAIQAKFKDIYEMNGYIEIAVSATSFIPCPPSVPGAAAVLQFLEKEARESNEAFNAFLQMKEMEQAAQKYENKMYEAFRGYDPSICDQVPPIQPITREVKTVEVEIEPKRILDPSGVVYEGSLSYPLEGVTVTIEYLDNGEWKQWDEAPLYNDQKPSYITDQTGFYRWDVPDGRWRVKYYKEGYNGGEPVVSGEMDVPPIWLDVNQEMSSAEPAEGTAAADSGGVTLTFSKPVRAEDITSGKVVLLNG
ncbi:MAG: hypothetical protein IKI65_00100, partial [Firmicutes bacterium]|nr:hypothetical protein [Bacillota bacterium]